jgi:hypothetical protein
VEGEEREKRKGGKEEGGKEEREEREGRSGERLRVPIPPLHLISEIFCDIAHGYLIHGKSFP